MLVTNLAYISIIDDMYMYWIMLKIGVFDLCFHYFDVSEKRQIGQQ